MIWKCCVLLDKRKESEFKDRYFSSVEFESAFDAEWRYLRHAPRDQWRYPRARKMASSKKDKHRDYYEIRMFASKTQWRPIGIFYGQDTFLILTLVQEKGNKFIPETWRDKADLARERIALKDFNHERYIEEIEIKI